MAVSAAETDTASGTTTSSSITFNGAGLGLGIGTPAADRLVFVLVANTDAASGGNFISSVTIGGIAAAPLANVNDGVGELEQGYYWLLVPTGVGVAVVVNFVGSSPAQNNVAVIVYKVTGANTTTPQSAAVTNLSATASVSQSITIPASGELLALSTQFNIAAITFSSWTNATADQDFGPTVGIVNYRMETALSATPGSTTVTATFSQSPFASSQTLLSLVALHAPVVGDTLSSRTLRFM